MKKMLMVSNGEHFAARILKTTAMLMIGLALGTAFWLASTPTANAQGNAAQLVAAELPAGKTMANAGKADYLAAVCSAVKKNRGAAPQIVSSAAAARPNWKNDVVRTAFECLGTNDCGLLGRVLRGAIAASPGDASELTALATDLAPGCASAFGTGGPAEDEGVFGLGPGNQNPPPGTLFGGGGQGNVVAICHNGHTIFVSPQGAEGHLNNHPGDTLGACQVTPNTNQ